MELHDRYMKLSTTGATVLEFLNDDPVRKSSMIREMIESCDKKIYNSVLDLKNLETYRMILSYEYRTLVNSRNDGSVTNVNSYVDIKKFFVRNDVNDFPNNEEFTLLYDIAVLQLVLRSSEQQLLRSFKDFHETRNSCKTTYNENENLSMRVYECFADSYNLRSHLWGGEKLEKDLEELRICIVSAIESWIKQEDDTEWRLLASLLPKLVVTFGAPNIVAPLRSMVLAVHDDLGKTLAALCVMADVCFPSEVKNIEKTHYEQCVGDEFWSLLLRGLISSVHQQRKQALYLAKRALDFIESHESEVSNALDTSKETMLPFVRDVSSIHERSTYPAKTNFFLILESLEEKQKHLVLPSLTRLPSLVEAYTERKSSSYGLNVFWLRCVFKRILGHNNYAVKTHGLREILRCDLDIYDEEFMDFLANILNDTLLYDYERSVEEKQPKIVTQLEEFFIRSEEAKVSLINTFVRAISRVSWCPVAIYWILRALVGITEERQIVTNAWTSEELRCVKNLIERNLTKYSKVLRTSSQKLVIQAFNGYTRRNSDLSDFELIGDTLYLAIESWRPNSTTMGRLAEHLSKLIESMEAQLYVTRICEAPMEKQSIKSCALSIFLLAESKLILNTKDCLAEKELRQLFQNLIGANLRPYANTALILKIMNLATNLYKFSVLWWDIRHKNNMVKRLISGYEESICQIIERSLEKMGISEFDEYLLAMNSFLRRSDSSFKTFREKCMRLVLDPREFSKRQWLYAVKGLYYCRDLSVIRQSKPDKTYIESVLRYFKDKILNNDERDSAESRVNSKGRFVSDCCNSVALLLGECIYELSSDLSPSNTHWLEELHTLVQTGNEQVVTPIAESILHLLHTCPLMIVQDLNIVISIVRQSWRSLFQLNKTKVVIVEISQLTELILSPKFLMLEGAKELAIECVNQLIEEGKNVPYLKIIFVEYMAYLSEEDLLHFWKSFMSCLLHVAVPRLDQRIEQTAILQCVGEFNKADEISSHARARAIIALINVLKKSNDSKSKFRENVLKDILLILQKNRNKRYFDNSHLHRLKHRAMQILLIIEPYLDEEERQILYDTMCDLLIAESNQLSVRLMQEWLLVRIYVENSVMRETIWKLFETAFEKRPGSIVSIASVVFHVSRVLDGDTQIDFIAKAISHLMPNCMSQQFSVRLYSQTILKKIYKMLPHDHRESVKYRGIYEAVEASLCRGNLMNNSQKVEDDFYFTIFHPFDAYSFEIIYHQLPRLTGLSVDEWIDPGSCPYWGSDDDIMPWHSDLNLSRIKTVKQSQRQTGVLGEETDSSVDGGFSDVQKKIIPWNSMVPLAQELSEISKAALVSRRNMHDDDTGIIVVASLIDRPPNLGGLARTCEIFGAKELVIGSLRYTDDREFQTLSVSAEKWIKITEMSCLRILDPNSPVKLGFDTEKNVKAHLLKNYLLEQRSKGWKLVGAEQTANSTNLCEMDFDKKTILLLGNEKDGIPANLIPILDTCVEIPQNGVVRSLNVHVTGAICIWQYVKQHSLA